MLICVLIVLFVLILIYTYVEKKQQTHFSIGTYLLFLYISSILLSFLEDNSNKVYTLEASFYFLTTLLLFIYPVLKFDQRKIEKFSLCNERLFRCLCNVFIIGEFVLIYIFCR